MLNYAAFLNVTQSSELGLARLEKSDQPVYWARIRLRVKMLISSSHVRCLLIRPTPKFNRHNAWVASALYKFGASSFLGGVSVGFRKLIVVAQAQISLPQAASGLALFLCSLLSSSSAQPSLE